MLCVTDQTDQRQQEGNRQSCQQLSACLSLMATDRPHRSARSCYAVTKSQCSQGDSVNHSLARVAGKLRLMSDVVLAELLFGLFRPADRISCAVLWE